jgi:hypothetical protein
MTWCCIHKPAVHGYSRPASRLRTFLSLLKHARSYVIYMTGNVLPLSPQSPVKLEEIQAVKEARNKRALHRAKGFDLINALVQVRG